MSSVTRISLNRNSNNNDTKFKAIPSQSNFFDSEIELKEVKESVYLYTNQLIFCYFCWCCLQKR